MFTQLKSQVRTHIRPEIIGATAQISFVLVVFLSRWEIPNTEFLQGILTGYSIVGNLFFLIYRSKFRKDEK